MNCMQCQGSKICSSAKRIIPGFLVLLIVVMASFAPAPPIKTHGVRTIVIDAGHGGKDPGNLGTGRYKLTEKNITLDISLQVGKYISEAFPDTKVIYTRTGDTYPTLKDRVKIANDSKCDLFISIHCDAFTKPSAKGSSTFVMGMHKTEESLRVAMQENASIYLEENYEEAYQNFDPKDPDTYIALTLRQNVYLDNSLNLSKKIQDQFRDRVGRPDRGVRQAGYYVICFTTMPSVLIELGFLTNAEEEDFLNSESGKSYMSSAIFRAFKEYKAEVEGLDLVDIEPTIEVEKPKQADPEKMEEPTGISGNWQSQLVNEHQSKGIEFQVQIVSSSKKLSKNAEEFNGIEKVYEYEINGQYKYAAGATRDIEKARANQALLRENGFTGAFIVGIKDGERISVQEALKQTN